MKTFSEHSANYFKDGITCPFCHKSAKWCENKEKYGRNYGKSYMCYYCKDCDAYVGCHENTRRPLGTMANKELREWRMKAHAYIDPLWKTRKKSRAEVYNFMAQKLGRKIHIGESDIETCQQILALTPPLTN